MALDRHLAPLGRDQHVTDRETEPRSAIALGGEERLEYLGQVLRRDPRPGIAHHDRHAAVNLETGLYRDRCFVGLPLGNGVRRVEQHVQDHLGEPCFVRPHQRHVREAAYELRAVANFGVGHPNAGVDDPMNVDGRELVRLARREHLEIADDGPDALGSFEGFVEQLGGPRGVVAFAQASGGDAQIPHHIGERIVDLVTDARCEPAERGQTLRRHQLHLEPTPLGDVAERGDDAGDRSPVRLVNEVRIGGDPHGVLAGLLPPSTYPRTALPSTSAFIPGRSSGPPTDPSARRSCHSGLRHRRSRTPSSVMPRISPARGFISVTVPSASWTMSPSSSAAITCGAVPRVRAHSSR